MSFGEYTVGALLCTLVYGCSIGVALVVLPRLRPGLAGVERVLGWAVLATAVLVGVHLLPGVLGILNRWTVAGSAVGALAAAYALCRTRPVGSALDPAPPPPPVAERRAAWLLAALGVAAITICALAYLRAHRTETPAGVDMLSFHLPTVARWIQRGSFWQAPELVPDWAQGDYPHNPEIVLLSTILPWRNDAFVRFVYFPWLAVTGLAVYALARRIDVPRSLAVLSGALVLAMPVVARSTLFSMKPDGVLWATFAAGLLFLVRHWRSRQRGDLVLAGLALGLAFGSKWSGFAAVVGLLVVWCGCWLAARRPLAHGARTLLVLGGWIFAAGGFWLVRNAVVSGSPVFASKVTLFGVTIFDAPPEPIIQKFGFSILHYAGRPSVLRHDIVPALWRAGRFTLVLAVFGVAVATALLVHARRSRSPVAPLVRAGIAASVVLGVVYIATPLTAVGPEGSPDALLVSLDARYGVTALIAAVPVAAWAASRAGRHMALVLAALTAAAVIYGLRQSVHLAPKDLLVTAVLLALAAAATAFARRLPRRGAQLAAALVVLGVFAAGYVQQQQLNRHRFPGDAAIAAIQAYAPANYRIGVAGTAVLHDTIPVYPAFGPRLRNQIQWIGPLVDGVLRNWPDQRGFRAAVARARFDLIVIEHGPPPYRALREDRWMQGTGYRPVARSRALTLYRRS